VYYQLIDYVKTYIKENPTTEKAIAIKNLYNSLTTDTSRIQLLKHCQKILNEIEEFFKFAIKICPHIDIVSDLIDYVLDQYEKDTPKQAQLIWNPRYQLILGKYQLKLKPNNLTIPCNIITICTK
jgi:hypothetical protein